MVPVLFEWLGQRLWISPQRCIFWEDQRALLLSDLHVGKAAHFRKAGIAVPQQIFQDDLQRLFHQVHHFKPTKIIITGDLFHSHSNAEHDWFGRWRETLTNTDVLLVRGNHEILSDEAYAGLGIEVVGHHYALDCFSFAHTLPDNTEVKQYHFTGHLHPGVRLNGRGKQAMVLPCFHFTSTHCILPAFSRFTGKHIIEPASDDHVFAVVDDGNSPLVVKM